MKRKVKESQVIDLLSQMGNFSNKQISIIVSLISKLNEENRNIYATKIDLKSMENRMLIRIFYLFTAINTIMTFIIKILAF